MLVTTKAIVLSAIKYSDTSLIVKCYTESEGVKSYMLKGVLAAKRGKLKASYFQPLTQLEIVANHRGKGTLERLSEVRVLYYFQSIHIDIIKNYIVFFLSETLASVLQEEEENKSMFKFIESSIQWLDTHEEVANFHIFFLLKLSRYLGFQPYEIMEDAKYFDLQEAEYTSIKPKHSYLSEDQLQLFNAFLGSDYDTFVYIRATKATRKELLKAIIRFYQFHLHGFREPKSLDVLDQLFG
ncbi:DNA replication and repair protein RecO [Zhouia amylolytica]|uniref:DNA repair protein RecO n=1 Tax=Zhouia amylolytica TaxID=376730 RepID=A0A1I6SNE6_9FLAO|nr:DNA repair protein RecO [Zhouia amylolytica]SFS78473.1 DNA replication and repair protein RecO [Zhouia amylolytica]